MYRQIGYQKLFENLCRQYPEIEPAFIRLVIQSNFSPPYTVATFWAVGRLIDDLL